MGSEGKVAIITGAGCGIGREVAFKFASEGIRIVVNDINSEHANETVGKIRSDNGEAVFIQADISKWDEAKKLIDKTVEAFGTVDILVNNAGITRDKLLRDMEEEDWDNVLNINLKGAFNCCKFATPIMVGKKSGKIVSLSSRAHLGNPGQANYSSSKAGILGLTRALALELGRFNINVNAIAPGMVETEGLKTHPKYDMIIERALKVTPLNRIGQTKDIANVIYFLVSDAASYITGEVIHVTGGRY